MSKNQIFSKTINVIRDHQSEYKPSQQSASKSRADQESEEENGKMYSTKIIKKPIKKVIVISNNGQQQQSVKKAGVLNIYKNEPQKQIQQTGSFPIFIRNIKEGSSQEDLRQLVNDESNILGISVNNKQATITFTNQQSADKAIELINSGKEMRAVPNYKIASEKVIVLGGYQGKNRLKDDGKLRMDKKESIFDRIQTK